MEEHKISLIIPVYNVEKYINQCLDSVINQTYTNIQIILVDDGSTDGCPRICDEYKEKDTRIEVIHKKNGGLADARNAGLRIATGDYIGYVDSDDYIHPKMYEILIKSCIENKSEISMCRFQIFENTATEHDYAQINTKTFTSDEILSAYINENTEELITPSVWCKLFKKEIVEELKFPTGKLCEDIVYTTKAFRKADKIMYLDAELYYYRQRMGSIMNDNSVLVKRIQQEIEQYNDRLEFVKQNCNDELIAGCKYALYNRLFLRYSGLPYRGGSHNVISLAKQLESQMDDLRGEARKYYKKAKTWSKGMQRVKIMGGLYFPRLFRRIKGEI
jgi:glycosyltransferase involved in cell wall biosynthesis